MANRIEHESEIFEAIEHVKLSVVPRFASGATEIFICVVIAERVDDFHNHSVFAFGPLVPEHLSRWMSALSISVSFAICKGLAKSIVTLSGDVAIPKILGLLRLFNAIGRPDVLVVLIDLCVFKVFNLKRCCILVDFNLCLGTFLSVLIQSQRHLLGVLMINV